MNWNALGAVSIDSARLACCRRWHAYLFPTRAGFDGPISEAIYFRAWDQTDGHANGAAGVDTTIHGGTTAFSLVFDSASLEVIPSLPPTADAESFTVSEGATATEADLDDGTSLLDGDTDPDLPAIR